MSRFHHMPFAPGGEFIWNRRVTHEGQTTEIGQSVDKSKFTPIRLRQLYEGRTIIPAPFGDGGPPAYLDNGKGEADRIAAQLAREEQGDGGQLDQSRPQAKPAPAKMPYTKKPAPAAAPPAAKAVANASAAKPKPKKRRAA